MARLAWLSRIHPVTEAPGCGLTHRETEAIPRRKRMEGKGGMIEERFEGGMNFRNARSVRVTVVHY